MEQPTESTAKPATSPGQPVSETTGHKLPPREFARWEVIAVLSIAVFPTLSLNIISYYEPPTNNSPDPIPYAISALYSCCVNVCRIVPILYLIWRSGDPWTRFGLVRPRRTDLLLGVVALVLNVSLKHFLPLWHLAGRSPSRSLPHQEADYVLMILRYGVGAFTEELIFRSYLITRLTRLLRSRGAALACSAILFGLVHRDPAAMYSAALGGIVYGIMYLWVGRIWPVAIGHFLYNAAIDLRILR